MIKTQIARVFSDYLDTSAVAQKYLESRNITKNTARVYNIGYCDNKLYEEKRILFEQCLDIYHESGRNIFSGHIMFPRYSIHSTVDAFCGRTIFDEKPKYIRSRNSTKVNENRLFGIQVLRWAKSDTIYLVEGYFDTVTLYQEGKVALGIGTTTLRTEDISFLKRTGIDNIVLLLDPDQAGEDATTRNLLRFPILQASTLPDNLDPDDYILLYHSLPEPINAIEYIYRHNEPKEIIKLLLALPNDACRKAAISEIVELDAK